MGLTLVSMRWGVDRLRRFCREELETEPDRTTSFLFINKDRDTLLLYFVDEIGEQLLTKKLEKGSFLLPVPAENGAPFVDLPFEVAAAVPLTVRRRWAALERVG